jgi:hypothetical protein
VKEIIMRKLVIAATVAAFAIPVVPATAQAWKPRPNVEREIQRDINQLENRIDRAALRRAISQREAFGLRRKTLGLQHLYERYVRDGLNRVEVAQLETGVNRLDRQLRLERRDSDGRRG